MKLIQTLTNSNLNLNKTARIFQTEPQKGMEAIHVPSWEVSVNYGGVDLAVWPLGLNLNYNQTARLVSNGLFVSVCRDNLGMYETAISYASQCEDFQTVTNGI